MVGRPLETKLEKERKTSKAKGLKLEKRHQRKMNLDQQGKSKMRGKGAEKGSYRSITFTEKGSKTPRTLAEGEVRGIKMISGSGRLKRGERRLERERRRFQRKQENASFTARRGGWLKHNPW